MIRSILLASVACWLGAPAQAWSQSNRLDPAEMKRRAKEDFDRRKAKAEELHGELVDAMEEAPETTPDEAARRKQLFDSLGGLQEELPDAEMAATNALADWQAAGSPEDPARQGTIIKALNGVVNLEDQVQGLRDGAQAVLEGQQVPNEAVGRSTPAARGEEEPGSPEIDPGVAEANEKLSIRHIQNNLDQSDAYREAVRADELLRRLQAAPLETDTGPGAPIGTQSEQWLDQLNGFYDGSAGQSDPDAMAAQQAADRLSSALANLATVEAKIADHNARQPVTPTVATQEEADNWWNAVAVPYNSEADALDSEQAQALAELDAASQ